MGKNRSDFQATEEFTMASLQREIESGQLDNEAYLSLPLQQQALVRKTLFNMYGQRINQLQAMSAMEFTIVALVKVVVQLVQNQTLTAEEQAFVAALGQVFAPHPLPLDATTWELSYVQNALQLAMANRLAYVEKKSEIVGL